MMLIRQAAWVKMFCATHGNEYFCEVDPEYIRDKFNLNGLQEIVPYFGEAYQVLLGKRSVSGPEGSDDLQFATKNLYGLIHARYILTTRGIDAMLKKYEAKVFGTCPRVCCNEQPLLPIGLSDKFGEGHVKNYCPKCVDIFIPDSSRYEHIDGAYFGPNFPHMFFMERPQLLP